MLVQIVTALLILWCIFPLTLVLGFHLLTTRRKASRLSMAANVALAFFIASALLILTGLEPNTPSAWAFSVAVGIVFSLFWLVRDNFMQSFKGYKTYGEYLEGERQKTEMRAEAWKRRVEAWRQRPWQERLRDWVRRMWRGDYP